MELIQNDSHSPSHQAAAVLAYVRFSLGGGIEGSWNGELKHYEAEPQVNEWYNGRERGYIVHMRSRDNNRQINVAFYEHRSSDMICVLAFEETTNNPPTLADLPKDHPFHESSGNCTMFSVGGAMEAGDHAAQLLRDFWDETAKPKG